MLSYDIYEDGCVIGHAALTREGLYWHIDARCDAQCAAHGDRIVRIFAHTAGGCVNLGVLLPEDGALRLVRRIAADSVTFDEQTRLSTSREAQWQPFSGTVEGIALSGALRRGRTLAVLCEPAQPFVLMPFFRVFCIRPIGGRQYWMAELDETGCHLAGLAALEEKMVDNGTDCDKISSAFPE